MWNIVVLMVLMAVTGVLTLRTSAALVTAQGNLASTTAAEMGIYRAAVIDYFSDNDVVATQVNTAALKRGGYLPRWSRMYQDAGELKWRNYRDADGVIYVYAARVANKHLAESSLAAELAKLAHHSVLFGVYRSSTASLHPPSGGSTPVPPLALSGMSIQDGAPLWLAMRK